MRPPLRRQGQCPRRARRSLAWQMLMLMLVALCMTLLSTQAQPSSPAPRGGGGAGAASATAPGKGHALLIGVGRFQNRSVQALDGPAHDVAAMADVLQRRVGIPRANIQTLVDERATLAGVRDAFAELLRRSRPGELVVILLSTHGTSAADSLLRPNLIQGSGALVLYDTDPERLDQTLLHGRSTRPGETSLVDLLRPLDSGGRKVWVIVDACHASNAARSAAATGAARLPSRAFPLPHNNRAAAQLQEGRAMAARLAAPPAYPFRNTVQLAAAGEGEVARDIPWRLLRDVPTIDGKPKGAMTDALLRVLEGQLPADADGDGALNLHEIHAAVYSFMARRAFGHSPVRQPALAEDSDGLLARPLITAAGGRSSAAVASAARPLRVAMDPRLPSAVQQQLQTLPGITAMPADGEAVDLRLRLAAGGTWEIATAGSEPVQRVAGDVPQLLQRVRQEQFAHQLSLTLARHRRGVLPFEMSPSAVGVQRLFGDTVCFSVRPDRDGHWMLLHLDANSEVFAFTRSVTAGRPGPTVPVGRGQHAVIPAQGAGLTVTAPAGLDRLYAVVFDQYPRGLEALSRGSMRVGQPELDNLLAVLASQAGRFTANEIFFMSFERPPGVILPPRLCEK